MKDRLNKKGFTLVELLAVIIILALVMVLVIPNVLDASSGAKEKSLRVYAERVASKALEQAALDNLTASFTSKSYTLKDLGFRNTGKYEGCVSVSNSGGTGGDMTMTVTINMTDGQYCFKNATNLDTIETAEIVHKDCPAVPTC